jgi:hypothetical protein
LISLLKSNNFYESLKVSMNINEKLNPLISIKKDKSKR